MSKFSWRIGLTIGLTLGSGVTAVLFVFGHAIYDFAKCEHSGQCDRYAAKYESENFPSSWWWLWDGSIVSASDTLAQWIMAFFTIAVVLLVWRTLIATQDMARDTRDIGQKQARAYLHAKFLDVKISEFNASDGSNIRFTAKIMIINSGSTPASQVEIFYDILEGKEAGVVEINLLLHGQKMEQRASFIPAKSDSNTSLTRVWNVESPKDFLRGGSNYIRLIYAFRFVDEFDETRETRVTSGTFHVFEGSLCFFPDKLEYTDPRK